jgi:hypothetical protein
MIRELDIKLDYSKLLECFNSLGLINLLDTEVKQLSVQHRGIGVDNQLFDGCGSLALDWEKYNPQIHNEIPKREIPISELDFTFICDYFKNSYVEEIVDILKKDYNVHRGRVMKMLPKTCLTTHKDNSHRIHIPIITNNDCFMVINDRVCKMECGKIYFANTKLPHTAVNSGIKDRYHLVFCTDKNFYTD